MAAEDLKQDDPLADFSCREIAFDGVAQKVYVAGGGPGVIVMAEMPGIRTGGGDSRPRQREGRGILPLRSTAHDQGLPQNAERPRCAGEPHLLRRVLIAGPGQGQGRAA